MPTDLQESVRAEIRAEMARQQITQRQLAERIGESQPWISDRLRGRTDPTVADLDRIAAALGVPVVRFIVGTAA